ncbi:MAG: hypothetical protein EOP84_03870 [Verrucomicrobiaceae bacterium]|nr:MAG: hypothetical protein EOP84_03870 [Verrucomicrobiaceae bacterium]
MGELSKNIGDDGERIVLSFFKNLGWHNPVTNVDLPCVLRKHHSLGNRPRSTHGIDLIFSYLCPITSRVRRNILVSVKNSFSENGPPDNGVVEKGLKDVAQATRCFFRSELRADFQSQGGASEVFDHGLLIRLDKSPDEKPFQAYIGDSSTAGINESHTIPLIETERFDFIDKVINYTKLIHNNQASFYHARSATTASAEHRLLSSSLLPFHNLIAGPITLQKPVDHGGSRLILISDEKFSIPSFQRLTGLALGISQGWAGITIVFPDYTPGLHKQSVQSSLLSLPSSQFASLIECDSLNTNSRFR